MSNSCYIIQEREFIKSGEEIYKIGKTTQKGTKRFNQYPKDSRLILLMEVENCHEFENQVKEFFNKKYQRRKDIGYEYYEGDKDEMVKDYFDLKKSIINVKIINSKNKNPQKNILDDNQTYYYPINELKNFYEILKNCINNFNDKNDTNIKYDYETHHILIPLYKFILNWNIRRNESINKELLKIKDKIEEDILEYTYLKSIVELLIETNINIENISETEQENLIINTLLLLDSNEFVSSFEKNNFIKKLYNTNEIKKVNNKKITNEVLLKIYNNIIEKKIIEDIIKIKNNLKTLNLNKNYLEYYEKINYEKINYEQRIVYSKYYKNNPSFQNFDLKMLKNIENEIKKDVNYELIQDDDNKYFGVKYETSINGARFITNITNLYDVVEENLEGLITNNIRDVYKNEYQYMIGLNIKFNPLSLINIIESAKNKVEISIEKIINIYNDYIKDVDKLIKYKKYEYDVENYSSESDTDDDNDYFEPMYDINDLNTEIYDYLIKHNEYPISISNSTYKKSMTIIYDTIKNSIKETDFYYVSSKTLQYIPNKKQMNNIIEYEIFLKCVMDNISINEFKKFAKSILCDNKNLKCQIMNSKYNIVEILLWLLYFIDYPLTKSI